MVNSHTVNMRPGQLEHHLDYEIWMLNETFRMVEAAPHALSQIGWTEECVTAASNAMKEAFCIHARLLIEFFNKNGTDSAIAFAPNYNSVAVPNFTRKLNTQVAHIIYSRDLGLGELIDDIDRMGMLDWIDTELRKWKAALPPTYDVSKIRNVDLLAKRLCVSSPQLASATNHLTYISDVIAGPATVVYPGTAPYLTGPTAPSGTKNRRAAMIPHFAAFWRY